MIQSKYKFDSEVGAKAQKLAYRLRSKRKDMIINIFVPIAIVIMVAMLIYDIKTNHNFVLDLILLISLIVLEIVSLIMPFIIFRNQKKYLDKLNDANFDFCISEYNKGVFKEKIYKNNEIIYANEVQYSKLVNYTIFDHYFLLIFNNYATLTFDLDNMLDGSKEDLIALCENAKVNNIKNKKKR